MAMKGIPLSIFKYHIYFMSSILYFRFTTLSDVIKRSTAIKGLPLSGFFYHIYFMSSILYLSSTTVKLSVSL